MPKTKVEMPHVVIPPRQKSKPKAHWADREIMAAAKEIDEGKWTPEADPEMDEAMAGMRIALGAGTAPATRPELGGVAFGNAATEAEFKNTEMLNLIGQHPRVLEALEKMKQEVYEAPDPHAAIERTLAMRELAEASTKPQLWDGQGRWMGHENEEMRYGRILTPGQFHERLCKIVGLGVIKISKRPVFTSPEAKSGRVGLYIKNPDWKGEKTVIDERGSTIAKLRKDGEALVRSAKTLRKLGQDEAAQKKINLAGEMAEEAMRLQMDLYAEQQLKPTEFLRVGTLQWPCSTEWMVMKFTQYGAVFAPKFLGWRTALLTMIRTKAITEQQAHKAFPVPSGPAAAWYLEQLAMLRNAEGTVQ